MSQPTPLTRSEIARMGGRARAKQFTPAYQREAQAKRTHESLVKSGKAGFAKLVEKHGFEGAMSKLVEHKLNHPTRPERAIMQHLDTMGIRYTREYRIDRFYFDFYLPDYQLLIEVDGEAFHGMTVHGDDRTAHDGLKDQAARNNNLSLLRLAGKHVLNTNFVLALPLTN